MEFGVSVRGQIVSLTRMSRGEPELQSVTSSSSFPPEYSLTCMLNFLIFFYFFLCDALEDSPSALSFVYKFKFIPIL